ncbi:hypothetical protein, partial [Candidatus Frankia alpina]|uniref:hypothetical protein n=1 Tax=Candidatus Frankia alpina TaxID=2699483 RepID=UPI0013D575D2
MYLTYQPEGSDEPQRWPYDPRKTFRAVEREMIERRSSMTYAEWSKAVLNGSSLARRVLLFMLLKREHPTTRYEDVDFAWDEVRLEYSRQEITEMRGQLGERFQGQDLLDAQAALDEEIATAIDDEEWTGKVQPPIVA